MKKLMVLFIIAHCAFLIAQVSEAQIIHIPADYTTIQQGIDAANQGDTVLVSPGTYVENINYNGKNITVASLFLTTQDTSYISQTVIDGNQAGSVVTFWGSEDSTAVLSGFTIKNGLGNYNGGGIYCSYSSPTLEHLIVDGNQAPTYWYYNGGGIYLNFSNPHLKDIILTNNVAGYGGGIYLAYSSADLQNVTISNDSSYYSGGGICLYFSSPYLQNVTISENSADYGGGVYFFCSFPVFDSLNRCNIYLNSSSSGTGNDLYSNCDLAVEVIVDTFTVMIPKSVHASPLQYFSFDILHGKLPQENITLYISPSGDDANSGLTTDDPLKTIQHAISIVNQNSANIYTLHLLNGTYSPSATGEWFPLTIPETVILEGESENGVIIDAEGQSGVISIYNPFVEISDLTITGGNSYSGGGIYCYYDSNPRLKNLTITGNHAEAGGGIYMDLSDPYLENVTVKNNSAHYGGGIRFWYSFPEFDSLNRCNIYLNNAATGTDLYSDYGPMNIIVDTFSVLYPTDIFAYPLSNFSFDILNGKIEQVMADLFVSPAGDDANSGLTEDDPFKTIRYALMKILADSLNPRTIHLLDGTYSPSTNGELFPVRMPEYISLSGESESGVILDAEGQSRVFEILNRQHAEISNMTVTGGYDNNQAGGILIENSSLYMQNVTVTGNSTGGYGGGMYISGYDNCPHLQNVTITGNSTEYGGGGGMYLFSTRPRLENVTIAGNSAGSGYGGGICFDYSDPLFDSVNRCNIYSNNAPMGRDLYSYYGQTHVIVDTFTVSIPKSIHAYPLNNFTFDILHGLLPQEYVDLYVSPEGDDENSGLTENDPLKTIRHTIDLVNADTMNLHTVHLQNGLYSPSSTGEMFPLNLPEYVSLEGQSESGVIIDAEEQSHVFEIFNPHVELRDLTITGGKLLSGYGGGITCSNSDPHLENLTVSGNNARYGGGIYFSSSNPYLKNITIKNNVATAGGGIYFDYDSSSPVSDTLDRCSIYLNNASDGRDLYSGYAHIEMALDTFTVLHPRSIHASPLDNFSFDILHGLLPQENISLFISPSGDDANSGMTENDPLQTVSHAISLIGEDEVNFYTIKLQNGTYSPSATGETFPLSLPEWVSLQGESESGAILDAEGQSGVLGLYNSSIEISDLTITGGNSYLGGGIACYYNSSPHLKNLTITSNHAEAGGGIYMEQTNPYLENVTVVDNQVTSVGGGIYIYYSSPRLKGVTVSRNTAGYSGGGIYFNNYSYSGFDSLDRCNIYLNRARTGHDLYASANVNIVLDTFSVLNPTGFHAFPLENFSFDILHGKLQQAEADLFVSPQGDDDNTGLTENDPLKTIFSACSMMLVDSLHTYTVHLLPGTYGPSTNGEIFPLWTYDYINLSGASESEVILDAEGQSAVMEVNNSVPVEISNLTITGGQTEGYGGGIYVTSYCSPELNNLVISGNTAIFGGGLFCEYNSSPALQNVRLTNNSAANGGGMYCADYSSPFLQNVTISNNSADGGGGGIYFSYSSTPAFDSLDRCNIYLNSALTGNDLYYNWWGGSMAVIVDTFTVLYPTSYHAYPVGNFHFDILNGKIEQVMADLYVSPGGDDVNSGLTEDDPFKTIHYALMKILADSLNPETIHLLDGTYSPSNNGEFFPVNMPEYISILGESESGVILDAEGQSRVFEFNEQQNVSISEMTVTGGNSFVGGGIYIGNSSPSIQNVTISGNSASGWGGGLYKEYAWGAPVLLQNVSVLDNSAENGGGVYCGNQQLALQDVSIKNNTAVNGGGIYCAEGPTLKNVTIAYNSADNGGGMFCDYSSPSFDSTDRCNIYLNNAVNGRDFYSNSFINVIVDTFTVMYPKFLHAYPLENFSFDILHGKIQQVNADLYISPDGNDANSGLTPSEPLKTIQHATEAIVEDSQHPNTIHLLNGTYSPSANGELFPVYIPEYISLAGESEAGVILDAEGQSRALELFDNQSTAISNLTIANGYTPESGAGIYSINSNPVLSFLTIRNNACGLQGGGIYLDRSNAELSQVTISDNYAGSNGGGISCYKSSVLLQHVDFISDSSDYNGGGMHCTSECSPVMRQVSFTGNYAGNSGGGAFLNNDTETVLDSVVFAENEAEINGGGIYLSSSDAMLSNVIIAGNSAANKGGGIYSFTSDPSLRLVNIQDNSSGTGGGLYITSGSADLNNVIFSNNSSSGDGGGIYSAGSELRLVNATLADNQAAYGGAIYCTNTGVVCWNSILWNESEYEVWFKEAYNPSSITFYYSDIRGGESGIMTNGNGTFSLSDGTINEDPFFTGSGEHPYSLLAESPCRNMGIPTIDTTGLQLPAYDLAGGPRIWLGRIDMGAYEWNNVGVEESAVGGRRSAVIAYPNPTHSTIEFRVSSFEFQRVSLKIYNTQGQEVAVVLDEEMPAGEHTVRWNAEELPAGLYFYRLAVGGQRSAVGGKIVKY